jgi:hypothetical protein
MGSVGSQVAEAGGEGCAEQGGVVGYHRGGPVAESESGVARRTGVGMRQAPVQRPNRSIQIF